MRQAELQDYAWLAIAYKLTTAPPKPNITLAGSPSSVGGPNVGGWLGLPTITKDFETIASHYEAQDPAASLPPDTHLDVVREHRKFQRVHAHLLRDQNAVFLWLPTGGNLSRQIVMSEHVRSHGTVNMNVSDPVGSEPVVDYRALSNPIDVDIMIANIEFMRSFMASPDFRAYGPVKAFLGLEFQGEKLRDWVREMIRPSNFHPVATASKKRRHIGGVVDEYWRVHGTSGLSVVDGSIMLMLPGANTQQTVYMIAEMTVVIIQETVGSVKSR